MVKIFPTFTNESFGSSPSTKLSGLSAIALPEDVYDVIATRTTSWPRSLKASGEMTSAGRRFEELRSVKGKETRTMSPRL